jgi:DNA-binding transcriptional MerR regulator
MKTYSISRLARACGFSRSTLLYYDRLGLLKPTGRTGSGYRYYTDADQRRLERIGHFRQAGLTLKEIRAVLSSGGKGRGEEAVRVATNPLTQKTNQPLQARPGFAFLLLLAQRPGAPELLCSA